MGDRSQESRKRNTGPRLYHTKSKHGCSRCRLRRVKCNESRPICNNCHRHNVSCVYDRPAGGDTLPAAAHQPQQRAVAAAAAATPAALSFPSPGSAGGPSPPGSGASLGMSLGGRVVPRQEYWKLRALHNFTVATSATMPACHLPGITECWSREVPVLALDHEPLLNALLALSALHLIAMGNGDADLSACRESWLEVALRTHRQGLDVVNVSNVDGACFTSSLLNVDGFASLKDRPLEPYEPPSSWFRLLMGPRAVVKAFDTILKDNKASVFNTLIESWADYMNAEILYNPVTRPTPAAAHLLEDHGLDDMRDPLVAEAYRQAAVYVGWLKAAVENQEHVMSIYRKIMAFPPLIHGPFADLVEEMAPRALAIVAYLFAAGVHCREIWTVGDAPQREVRGLCSRIPSELQHLVVWPLRVLSKMEERPPLNAT